MREVNLGMNEIGDEGFEAVMRYAERDEGMRELKMQGNCVKVSGVRLSSSNSVSLKSTHTRCSPSQS